MSQASTRRASRSDGNDQAKIALYVLAKSIKVDNETARNLRLTCKVIKLGFDNTNKRLKIPAHEYT